MCTGLERRGLRALWLMIAAFLALTVAGCGTAGSPPAGSTAYCTDDPAQPRPSAEIVAADAAAKAGQRSTAKQAYAATLASSSNARDRECAVIGLAQIEQAEAETDSLGMSASGWQNFVSNVLSPIWSLGLPTLILFALLLIAARGVSRGIPVSAKGTRTASPGSRRGMTAWYVLGVATVLSASLLAVLGLSGATLSPTRLAAPYLVLLAALLLFAGSAAGVLTLLWVVGRTRGQTVVDSLALIIDGAVFTVVVTMVLAAAGEQSFHFTPVEQIVVALLMAVAGVILVGWVRGVSLALVIHGAKADGSDNTAAAQLLRARLFDIGGKPASGILQPSGTDVATLPEALVGIVPDGAGGKLVANLISFFRPATPWSVEIAQVGDTELDIVVRRNGRQVAAELVNSNDFGWPPRRAGTADEVGTAADVAPSDGEAKTGPTSARTADVTSALLYNCASAIVLTAFAPRYDHIAQGLNLATRWRSIAMRVTGTSLQTGLSDRQRLDFLSQAVAFDATNWTASGALLLARDGQDSSLEGAIRLRDGFDRLCRDFQLAQPQSMDTPVHWRMLYNKVVAIVNWVDFVAPHGGDSASRQRQLVEAVHTAKVLLYLLEHPQSPVTPSDDQNEPNSRTDIRFAVKEVLRGIDPSTDTNPYQPTTRVGYYQRACTNATLAEAVWNDVLDDLQIATTYEPLRRWARSDPSLQRLQSAHHRLRRPKVPSPDLAQLTRFRVLVGEPVPEKLIDLSPFAFKTDRLALLGLTTPEAVASRPVGWLSTEGEVSVGVARRWRGIAALAIQVDSIPMVDLLLSIGIDNRDAFRQAAERPAKLAGQLRTASAGRAVVPPSAHQLRAWADG